MSTSQIRAEGITSFKVSFILFITIEATSEAYPSIEGAVATTISGFPVVLAVTLQRSFITPLPTQRIASQLTSRLRTMLPTANSEGVTLFSGAQGIIWSE